MLKKTPSSESHEIFFFLPFFDCGTKIFLFAWALPPPPTSAHGTAIGSTHASGACASAPDHSCRRPFLRRILGIYMRLLRKTFSMWSAGVRCFILLNRYWGIVTVSGFPRVIRPQILTWGLPDPRLYRTTSLAISSGGRLDY